MQLYDLPSVTHVHLEKIPDFSLRNRVVMPFSQKLLDSPGIARDIFCRENAFKETHQPLFAELLASVLKIGLAFRVILMLLP